MIENKTFENLKNFIKLVSDKFSPALKDFVLQKQKCKEEYTNSQQKSLELNKKFVKETDNETLSEIMSQFDVPKKESQ